MSDVLKFAKGNAKLGKNIYTFSLLSGITCPGALQCKSWVDSTSRKIVDGAETVFRCFSASQEATYPNVYASRRHNFELVRKCLADNTLVDLIKRSIPLNANMVRIHVAGDFFSQNYFDAWIAVANAMPNVVFYAYTKSISFWINRLQQIPSNFRLTASYGGRHDDLIETHKLRSAKVVYSVAEANGLPIDHDDSHAYASGNQSFALLLHGIQPKGSGASKALSVLRKEGIGGYGKQKEKRVLVA